MLKVLIADDEPYVREGIKNIVPWEECGFVVCGEGIDGDDTYEKICDLNPDLVLIDIKMPGKLGLDVIKESVKNGFKGKFVIISGYSDFEYAKIAIKYGVKSYLLKPIDEDELYDIAVKLRKEIEDEKKRLEKLEIQKGFVKEYALVQLMLGKTVENYNELINSLNCTSYVVALVSNCNDKVNNENLIELENCIRKKISNINNIEVCKVKNKVAILFGDTNNNHINNILNNIKEEVNKSLDGGTFITIGKYVETIDKIILSYKNASDLMSKRFSFLEYEIISDIQLSKIKEKKLIEDEIEILNKVYNYVEIGEVKNIKELLYKFKDILQYNLYSEEKIKVLITKSCLAFNEKIKNDYEINKEDIKNNEQIIEDIYNQESLNETIEYLIKRFCDISKMISFNTSDKSIKRVVKYIEKNYYTDLKLELLSEIFNYNSAYLGKVFKSHTGMSFNTYLDTIRIDKAKKLLMEDKIKVYQVCDKVGYKNIDYFHSKFKKYVGVSPLNYKKQVEGGKIS